MIPWNMIQQVHVSGNYWSSEAEPESEFTPTACQMVANSFTLYYFTFIYYSFCFVIMRVFFTSSPAVCMSMLCGGAVIRTNIHWNTHTHWYAGRQAIVYPCLLYRVGHQLPCRNLPAAPAGELLAVGYLNRKYVAMFSRSQPTCKW